MNKELSELRHSARGSLNAMKLCVCALELPCSPTEKLEFLDDVISASDTMCSVMDQLSALPDSSSTPESTG